MDGSLHFSDTRQKVKQIGQDFVLYNKNTNGRPISTLFKILKSRSVNKLESNYTQTGGMVIQDIMEKDLLERSFP